MEKLKNYAKVEFASECHFFMGDKRLNFFIMENEEDSFCIGYSDRDLGRSVFSKETYNSVEQCEAALENILNSSLDKKTDAIKNALGSLADIWGKD